MIKYTIYICSSIELYEEEPSQGRKYVTVTTYADSASEAKEKAKAIYKDNFKLIKTTMTAEEIERQRVNSQKMLGVIIAYAGAMLGNAGMVCGGAIPKHDPYTALKDRKMDNMSALDILEKYCV